MGKLLKAIHERIIESGEAGAVKRARRREDFAEIKKRHKEIYAEEFKKASVEQIKRKARMEAAQRFRTTQEKTQDLFKAFGSLSGKPTTKKVETQKVQQKKTKKKAHDPFDINLDLGLDF